MAKVMIKNLQNADVREIELPEEIFDYPLKEHLIYEAVKNFRANQRQGTHATKNRALVTGSLKKLWRQKGTGRARMGSAKSPLWRSGGTIFGPQPRDYSYNMPKKARRNALKSVLSEKLRNNRLYVIDSLQIESVKTKDAVNTLKRFPFDKLLIVDVVENINLTRSTQNIPNIKAIDYREINVYDSLDYGYIMFSEDAVNKLSEVLR